MKKDVLMKEFFEKRIQEITTKEKEEQESLYLNCLGCLRYENGITPVCCSCARFYPDRYLKGKKK